MAAHLLLILLWQVVLPTSAYSEWLLRPDSEWNAQSILSSTQFVLISGIALIVAWRTQSGSILRRAYFIVLALTFLYLGHVEFFARAVCFIDWKACMQLLGVTLAFATAIVAIRTPKHLRLWQACLFLGLAFIAAGGIILDDLKPLCGSVSIFKLEGCFRANNAPDEFLEFIGGWLVLLSVLGQLSESTSKLRPRFRRALYGWVVLWVLLLFANSPISVHLFQLPGKPISVDFESRVAHHFASFDAHGLPTAIFLYVPDDLTGNDVGYSVHIVDQSGGASIAQFDNLAGRSYRLGIGSRGYLHVYRQKVDLELPPQVPTNQALWSVLTIWRKSGGEHTPLQVKSSHLPLLDDTQVILGELVLPAESTPATSPPLARFENGFMLDEVALPELAQAGETLDITFGWRAHEAGQTDAIQFLHLGHEDTGEWFVYDQPPLGPRLPTRLWYAGMADSEIWQVPLPADLEPGRYSVFTGLYRASDRERIGAADAEGKPWLDDRVALGEIVLGDT